MARSAPARGARASRGEGPLDYEEYGGAPLRACGAGSSLSRIVQRAGDQKRDPAAGSLARCAWTSRSPGPSPARGHAAASGSAIPVRQSRGGKRGIGKS